MKTILFVHQSSQVFADIRRALDEQRDRWHVHFAHDADTALALPYAFDIVIADMWMPGVDGITLLSQLRSRQPQAARLLVSHHSEAATERAACAAAVAYSVFAKPFRPGELIRNIERVLALQDAFDNPELRRTVGLIGTLPSLSATYTALTAAVRDPDSSIATVADIIERDAAMAAKVLQFASNGFFRQSQKMTSLRSAVSYLGLETIKNLALATETFRIFKPHPSIPRGFLGDLQARATRAATIAGALPLKPRERDAAVIATLLHCLGELVLASSLPDRFAAALAFAASTPCPQFEAEEQIFGTSHAEIGAYLLGLWEIANPIVEAIAHHHRPTRLPHRNTVEGLDVATAVYLASLLADHIGLHPDDLNGEHLVETERQNLETLGLPAEFQDYVAIAAEALFACQ